MAVIYHVESQPGYPGPAEYQSGTTIAPGAIYTETLPPGTPLPYKMRQITRNTKDADTGWVIDGGIILMDSGVQVLPVFDEQKLRKYLEDAQRRGQSINPEAIQTLRVMHGHMRREKGLKLLLPHGDREFTIRLHAPKPESTVYMSKPSPWG